MPRAADCNCVPCLRARYRQDVMTPREESAHLYGELVRPPEVYETWLRSIELRPVVGYALGRGLNGEHLVRATHFDSCTIPYPTPTARSTETPVNPSTNRSVPTMPQARQQPHATTAPAAIPVQTVTRHGERTRCSNIDCICARRTPLTLEYLRSVTMFQVTNRAPAPTGITPPPDSLLNALLSPNNICQSCGFCMTNMPEYQGQNSEGTSTWTPGRGHCGCADCVLCEPLSNGNHRRHPDSTWCSNCGRCPNACLCRRCTRCHSRHPASDMRWCTHEMHELAPICAPCCADYQAAFARQLEEEMRAMLSQPPWTRHDIAPTQGRALEFRVGKPHKLWPLTRCVSLEVEVCGSTGDKTTKSNVNGRGIIDKYMHLRKYLKHEGKNTLCVQDGSLPGGGYELNLVPSSGDKWVEQLTALNKALKADEAFVTQQAGMHCHVDTRDLDEPSLLRLCTLYSKLENTLFSIVEPTRTNNTYCTKVANNMAQVLKEAADPDTQKKYKKGNDALHKVIYGIAPVNADSIRRLEGMKQQRGITHYWALNVHSHFYRGSVEFRIHHGTVDRKQWLNWSLVCASIVETAKSKSDAVCDAVTSDVAGLKSIMPSEWSRKWIDSRVEAFK